MTLSRPGRAGRAARASAADVKNRALADTCHGVLRRDASHLIMCAEQRGIALPGPLGYTDGTLRTFNGPPGPGRGIVCLSARSPESRFFRELMMSSTFDTVANIIAETCDIPRDTIKPESHAIDDLGIDSLDFLDIAFAIDKAFGIKLPLEQWTQEVNDGKATTEQYFVLKNLCARIDGLVAAKGA
jgi:acyl carrier protein